MYLVFLYILTLGELEIVHNEYVLISLMVVV